MKILKYKIYCETDAKWEYVYKEESESAPTTCPINTAHTIVSNSVAVDSIAVDSPPVDIDGRSLIRPVAAKAGWTYFYCPIEFTTAKLNSLNSKKHDNTNRSGISYKIYDSNDAEITEVQNEVNAVKTVVDFEPTYDYEVIGGQLQQHTKPTTNVRVWVIAVPDVAEQYGGSKEIVGGANLKFIDSTDKINADGRVSKYMTYNATNHTNKIRVILRHDAGIQHCAMLILEMFKA